MVNGHWYGLYRAATPFTVSRWGESPGQRPSDPQR
jgi:hypothetical protein